MPLSLADAIALGIENNLAVEIARHDPLIADLDLSVAWSAYDPIISGDAGYRDDRQPPTSSLQGGKTQVLDGSLGATWQLPVWGAEVGVSYGASKTEALGPFTSALPQWDSGLTFNASIPVLRNFIWNAAWLGIKTHEIRVDKSNRTFEDTLIKTIANIETAYWNLVASHEQLNVALKSLESSKALLRQVETQYEVGVVSNVDVVEAEAGVAERDFSLIMATNGYPGSYPKGSPISGLENASQDQAVTVFHAGTLRDLDGQVTSNGGRVLGVTARGGDIRLAQKIAYQAIDRIEWPGGFCRRDIGWRAIDRLG